MLTKRMLAVYGPLQTFLSRFPTLKKLLKSAGLYAWRWEVRLRARDWRELPNPDELYWINPARIERTCQLRSYNKYHARGTVLGGDWDESTTSFDDLDVYRAFEAHFCDGTAWQETEFYQRVLSEITQGKTKWSCRNRSEFKKRLDDLDHLFEEISENGYKSQSELAQVGDVSFSGEDEVTVRIDRNGWPLFEDGRHRLSIAKILKLESIPMKVTVRHERWYDFIKEVRAYAKSHGGRVYQPITHFDLGGIPCLHGHERYELIKANLPIESGELLDIGAHWGYFCHRFENLGFDCFAVEGDVRAAYMLEKLKLAERKEFKVIKSSIFDYTEKNDFDVVLALNILHHFLKTRAKYEALIGFLSRLDTQIMFLQTHEPGSAQMKGSYRNLQPEELVDLVSKHSGLSSSEHIGTTPDQRPIFLLTR